MVGAANVALQSPSSYKTCGEHCKAQKKSQEIKVIKDTKKKAVTIVAVGQRR